LPDVAENQVLVVLDQQKVAALLF